MNGWASANDKDNQKGLYLARAGLCIVCHTDYENNGKPLAGGRPMETPFGTLYSTNITPDRETGIGKWTDKDFLRAMRKGVRPDGAHLFPAFPYTAYTNMSDRDILALKAYLFSLKPVRWKNKPVEMNAPFRWRFLLGSWKWMNLKGGPFQADSSQSAQWNRGAYLVQAVTHCAECHTQRDAFGGLKKDMLLAGTVEGPEGELAINITPDRETGVGDWSVDDIAELLKSGLKPDSDDVQGLMQEIIEHGYKFMNKQDREAIAVYLRTVKSIRNKVEAED